MSASPTDTRDMEPVLLVEEVAEAGTVRLRLDPEQVRGIPNHPSSGFYSQQTIIIGPLYLSDEKPIRSKMAGDFTSCLIDLDFLPDSLSFRPLEQLAVSQHINAPYYTILCLEGLGSCRGCQEPAHQK